jgi:hypothetical protein
MRRSLSFLSVLAAATMLIALGACDSADSATPAGDEALSILEPASGANVSTPFTVRVKTSEPLGTSESGNHHIHIWFDGNEEEYQISYSDTAQISVVPAGAHKMTVSLRHANHSDAGPRVEIPLTVGTGGAPATTGGGEDEYPY